MSESERESGNGAGKLSPERHAYFRRVERALARYRETEQRAEDALMDARIVVHALQKELGRVWDETVETHGLRADGKYTVDDAGRIIEILPDESAG